jgi:hypothetical protein
MADRDLFNHGNGKGDVPRTTFDEKWAKRFKQTNLGKGPKASEDPKFKKVGLGRYRVVY